MNIYDRWPIGSEIMYWLNAKVERIVAHLEGVWYGTQDPWFCIATVPVSPKIRPGSDQESHWLNYGMTPEKWLSSSNNRRVVAGELPERFWVHCINGSFYAERIEDVQILFPAHYLTVLVSGDRHNYIVVSDDPGDPGVGMSGGRVAYSSMGYVGQVGTPNEIPIAVSREEGDDVKDDPYGLIEVVERIIARRYPNER